MYPRVFIAIQTILISFIYTWGWTCLVVPKHPSKVNDADILLVGVLFVPLIIVGTLFNIKLAWKSAHYFYGMTEQQFLDLFKW